MNIDLPPSDERYLDEIVNQGYFSNKTEAVSYALGKIKEEHQKESQFLQAVMVGKRQADAGQCVPYTPELIAQLGQNAIKNSRSGKKINPDVMPKL